MLSKEVSSTIFKVFGMIRSGIEPRSSRPLANTLPTRPMSRWYLIIYIHKLWIQAHLKIRYIGIDFTLFYFIVEILWYRSAFMRIKCSILLMETVRSDKLYIYYIILYYIIYIYIYYIYICIYIYTHTHIHYIYITHTHTHYIYITHTHM